MIFFFVPETAFRRSAHLNLDFASSDDVPLHDQKNSDDDTNTRPAQASDSVTSTTRISSTKNESHEEPDRHNGHPISSDIPKKTFIQSLLPFDGRKSDESYWKLLLRPFPLFAHPAILWACLIQGTMIGWTVFIGIVLAAIFLGPPLFWGEVQTGYAYTGAFLGALLGFLIAGALADWSAKFMTKKNGGIYEVGLIPRYSGREREEGEKISGGLCLPVWPFTRLSSPSLEGEDLKAQLTLAVA
jgi:hypothetical protein